MSHSVADWYNKLTPYVMAYIHKTTPDEEMEKFKKEGKRTLPL